jgi:hypothetical protein
MPDMPFGLECGVSQTGGDVVEETTEDRRLVALLDIMLDRVDVGVAKELVNVEDVLANTKLAVGTGVADMKYKQL